MSKLDNILFYASMSFLLLCIFLTFLFFGPKKIIEKEEFVFVTSDKEEMLNLTLELIEEGDLLLSRPKSLIDGYEYDTKNRINLNQLTYFFWYNIFDKLIINSMGNTYWHIGIYIGQEKINSLYQGVYEHEINENLINYKYFKVLKIKTSEENKILVTLKKESKIARSVWGTTRMLIANNIKGVTEGWKKQLELVGTGYRSEVAGNTLVLTVGYSHPIKVEAPEGITFKVEKSVINVEGIDKQIVGQVSADIRSCRPPEPYKGKGVKYVGEYIRRKAGKAAKAAA